MNLCIKDVSLETVLFPYSCKVENFKFQIVTARLNPLEGKFKNCQFLGFKYNLEKSSRKAA
jgi:hypothetical protein